MPPAYSQESLWWPPLSPASCIARCGRRKPRKCPSNPWGRFDRPQSSSPTLPQPEPQKWNETGKLAHSLKIPPSRHQNERSAIAALSSGHKLVLSKPHVITTPEPSKEGVEWKWPNVPMNLSISDLPKCDRRGQVKSWAKLRGGA